MGNIRLWGIDACDVTRASRVGVFEIDEFSAAVLESILSLDFFMYIFVFLQDFSLFYFAVPIYATYVLRLQET